jgi:hypothetical protein
MKVIRSGLGAMAVAATLSAAPLAAHAAVYITHRGQTAVALAPGFLSALSGASIAPAAIAPGQLDAFGGTTYAVFPITTGQVDTASRTGEIDHSGGLTLTSGSKVVQLTSFAIDLYSGAAPVLTGLVSANGSLVGRVPLFDLSLGGAQIGDQFDLLTVANVTLTLDPVATGALNSVFGISLPTAPGAITVGTADIAALLQVNNNSWW